MADMVGMRSTAPSTSIQRKFVLQTRQYIHSLLMANSMGDTKLNSDNSETQQRTPKGGCELWAKIFTI